MARIVDRLPVQGLEARYRAARTVTEARHVRTIRLLARGRAVLDVAGVPAFTPRRVEESAARYNAHGPEASGDRRRRNGRTASVPTPELSVASAVGRLGRTVARAARGRRGVDRPRGRPVDGMATRGGAGAPAARLGGAGAARPVHPGAAPAPPVRGRAAGAGCFRERVLVAVERAKAAHPGGPVEVRAEDEHRLGLKPVRRRVWAPVGERPTALGHHRFERLHAAAFVQPTGGETSRYLRSRLNEPFFEALLADSARQSGAGRERHVALVPDNAGWHGSKGPAVPDGITLVFLPPYSPELQPAKRLWPLVDEPIADGHFAGLADLEAVLAERRRRLDAATIKPHTGSHRWPKPDRPN